MSDTTKGCCCTPGDACDYHLATCVVCPRPCRGHPPVIRTAIIMRGLPGSGKSTIAARLAPDEHICSTDKQCMVDGEYRREAAKAAERHAANLALFTQLCERGVETVVCDNTNIKLWEFARYIAVAEQHGYNVAIITVGNPSNINHIAQCVERNTHRVPRETIERMARGFER